MPQKGPALSSHSSFQFYRKATSSAYSNTPRAKIDRRAGIIHLLPLLLVAALVVVGALLVLRIKVGTPTKDRQAVAPQTGYQNPFDKNSQYVSPFSDYKNPFDNLKQ